MVNIKVDSKKLEAELKDFAKKLNIEASDAVVQLAQAGANQLAHRVQPYGTNTKAKNILEKAVYKDMSKVYWDAPRTYNEIKKIDRKLAAAYGMAIERGDTDKAEKIAQKVIFSFRVEALDNGQRLESARGSKGRVGLEKPVGISNASDLKALKDKKALTAGTAKAGWLQAGASIGMKKRIPGWLKKPGQLGIGKVSRRGWNTVVTLINLVKYASSVCSGTMINQSINAAYKNTFNNLKKRIDALAKKI